MVRTLTSVFLTVTVLLTPLGLSPGIVLSKQPAKSPGTRSQDPTTQSSGAASEVALASATPVDGGILLQWRIDSGADNPGFYVYRMRDRRISLATRIPGPVSSDGGYSYRWFDASGTSNSIYYIESISTNGNTRVRSKVYYAVVPVSQSGDQPSTEASGSGSGAGAAQWVEEFPASLGGLQSQLPDSPMNQFDIATQAALKIQVKTDGWYRVTQQQMSAAGFNPTVDIRNLSLFVNGQEIAILTGKDTGQLTSGDYIEFYGQGLDTPDTATRIYYLIAGTTAGKRAHGDAHIERPPVPPLTQRLPSQQTQPFGLDLTYRATWFTLLNWIAGEMTVSPRDERGAPVSAPSGPDSSVTAPLPPGVEPSPATVSPLNIASPEETKKMTPGTAVHDEPLTSVLKVAVPSAAPKSVSKSRKGKSHRRRYRSSVKRSKQRYSHALDQAAASGLSFNDTLQIKERFNYNPQLLNGLNFFGTTIGTTFPLTKTLTIHDLQSSADGPVRLEVALQGLSFQNHQVNILCNNTLVGTMTNFSAREHSVQTFSIPVAQLVEGDNTIKIAPVPTSEFLGLDHIKLTYPRSYRAYNDSLRFSLRANQSQPVDGFSTPNVRLIDISDPTTIKVTRPIVVAGAGSYAIAVPPGQRTKAGRTMYALPEGQFQTPTGFSLNQPSTLNASIGADLVIIAPRDFIPSLAPLVAQRQQQGFSVLVADVEDIYDEFSFGAHSTPALQEFLSWARSHWATPPRYVLLAGDASYDPRENLSTVVTRSRIRQHDSQHPGCADLGDNARDFSMALYPLPRNVNFNSTPCSDSSGVVISEIYDGGGDKANALANGYIELFNRGPSPVNVNGWSVQYASATGTTWQVTNLSNVTIEPGHYYLVQEAGLGGVYPLAPPYAPVPDAIGNISINRSQGKVALVSSTAPLAGACPVGGSILDFVGYGSSVNCFQGSGPAAVSTDFVPTKEIDTVYGVACSDDALADFDNDGIAEIPVGRLPAGTPTEANLMVSKIVTFSKANVPQTALFVADAQGNYYWNFETHSDELANLLPPGIGNQKIYLASQPSPAACKANIINSINLGVALVNYQGHGNVNAWSGASIFTTDDALNLTNGNRLPLIVVADCLNGLFNDPAQDGLGEAFLKAQHGGGVAVYASSGETLPDGQQEMSIKVYQLLFGPQSMALGDITRQAKAATLDMDVRRTWILLGDPTMKIW
jgi:hypothetical protein